LCQSYAAICSSEDSASQSSPIVTWQVLLCAILKQSIICTRLACSSTFCASLASSLLYFSGMVRQSSRFCWLDQDLFRCPSCQITDCAGSRCSRGYGVDEAESPLDCIHVPTSRWSESRSVHVWVRHDAFFCNRLGDAFTEGRLSFRGKGEYVLDRRMSVGYLPELVLGGFAVTVAFQAVLAAFPR
jgi:hypothetical protein